MGAGGGCCEISAQMTQHDLLEDSIPIIESDTKTDVEEMVRSVAAEASPLLERGGEEFRTTEWESSASFRDEDGIGIVVSSASRESYDTWLEEESQDEGGVAGEMDSPDDG